MMIQPDLVEYSLTGDQITLEVVLHQSSLPAGQGACRRAGEDLRDFTMSTRTSSLLRFVKSSEKKTTEQITLTEKSPEGGGGGNHPNKKSERVTQIFVEIKDL